MAGLRFGFPRLARRSPLPLWPGRTRPKRTFPSRSQAGAGGQGVAGPLPAAIFDSCVQCGLCLPACPTYRETYREQSSPRGRLHLMRAVHEGRIDVLDPVFTGQMAECLDCRSCEANCPSGVRYGAALEPARAQILAARRQRGLLSWRERLLRQVVYGALFRDLRLLRGAGRAARLYQRSGAQAFARRSGLLRRLGLARLEGQLPPISRRFLVPRGQIIPAAGERRGRVALLTGCIMSTAFAETHAATIRVLTRNGWEVSLPAGQGCCGALHAHAGERQAARALARANITAFADADVIVSNAAGCGAMLKEYGELLADSPQWAAQAAALAARARDVTELLAETPLRGPLRALPEVVTYQDACHLAHAQRQSAAPRALLRQVPGLRLAEMAEPALCCGSAGTYSLTQPEMSGRLRARKLGHARATGARLIVSANPGCILQLRAGRDGETPVVHLMDVLARAYGPPPPPAAR